MAWELTQVDIGKCRDEGAPGIADVILKHLHFAQDRGNRLYRFKQGKYLSDGEEFIRKQVKRLLNAAGLGSKWTSRKANEVTEYIRADAVVLWEIPPIDRISLLNGILKVNTGELLPHTPDYLSTVQVPVNYNPTAQCKEWDKFITDTFPGDAQAVAYEIIAWLMIPSKEIQKAILLLGEGCNGKSTFLRAVIEFLGKDNVATLSLHKLENDRFASARLVGKLANICPDIPNRKLETTTVFKTITGGDRMSAEYKFRDTFDFTPFARLVFSANELPRSSDATEGFYRRLIILPFENTFKEDPEVGRRLDAALSEPKELSGVLNRALKALPAVLKNGFSVSPTMKAAHNVYRRMSDPVREWLDQNIEQDPGGWIAKSALYNAYEEDTCRDGRIPLAQKSFGSRLRDLIELKESQKTEGGKVTWGYAGIRFAEESLHGIH